MPAADNAAGGALYESISISDYEINTFETAKEQNLNILGITVYLQETCILKAARAFLVFKALEELGEVMKAVPERTEWHNIVLWRGLAETAEKYVRKGDKLYIEGKIRSRSYDDQNGVKRYVVEIFGDNMEMLSSPRQSQQAPQSAPAQPSGAQPVQQGSAAQSAPAGEMSDDLPF